VIDGVEHVMSEVADDIEQWHSQVFNVGKHKTDFVVLE